MAQYSAMIHRAAGGTVPFIFTSDENPAMLTDPKHADFILCQLHVVKVEPGDWLRVYADHQLYRKASILSL